jgi:hypothetical protein
MGNALTSPGREIIIQEPNTTPTHTCTRRDELLVRRVQNISSSQSQLTTSDSNCSSPSARSGMLICAASAFAATTQPGAASLLGFFRRVSARFARTCSCRSFRNHAARAVTATAAGRAAAASRPISGTFARRRLLGTCAALTAPSRALPTPSRALPTRSATFAIARSAALRRLCAF